jgi:elongation factor Tu
MRSAQKGDLENKAS